MRCCYLETIYREKSAENAFFQACPENDDIIFFIHGYRLIADETRRLGDRD